MDITKFGNNVRIGKNYSVNNFRRTRDLSFGSYKGFAGDSVSLTGTKSKNLPGKTSKRLSIKNVAAALAVAGLFFFGADSKVKARGSSGENTVSYPAVMLELKGSVKNYKFPFVPDEVIKMINGVLKDANITADYTPTLFDNLNFYNRHMQVGDKNRAALFAINVASEVLDIASQNSRIDNATKIAESFGLNAKLSDEQKDEITNPELSYLERKLIFRSYMQQNNKDIIPEDLITHSNKLLKAEIIRQKAEFPPEADEITSDYNPFPDKQTSKVENPAVEERDIENTSAEGVNTVTQEYSGDFKDKVFYDTKKIIEQTETYEPMSISFDESGAKRIGYGCVSYPGEFDDYGNVTKRYILKDGKTETRTFNLYDFMSKEFAGELTELSMLECMAATDEITGTEFKDPSLYVLPVETGYLCGPNSLYKCRNLTGSLENLNNVEKGSSDYYEYILKACIEASDVGVSDFGTGAGHFNRHIRFINLFLEYQNIPKIDEDATFQEFVTRTETNSDAVNIARDIIGRHVWNSIKQVQK